MEAETQITMVILERMILWISEMEIKSNEQIFGFEEQWKAFT